jgi:anion-transporting  ArsA/GET3 family ATPase
MDPRPLQFVVGKGGVGKSTITAALAIAHARAGRRVLAVELGRREGLSRAEYLELIVPIRRLLNIVFTSRLYRYFVAAAPGLKELTAVGKIWYERQKEDADGRPLWDTIVVDAGASGQSLQYLQMPGAAARTFRKGLVHRESERVASLLGDAGTTAVHVVAIPEDMPLTEAREVLGRLRGDLALPVGTVYLNRTRTPPPQGVEAAVAALAEVPGSALHGRLAAAVSTTANRTLVWTVLQEDKLARFEADSRARCVRLPLLVAEEFGLHEIERLADVLADERSGETR